MRSRYADLWEQYWRQEATCRGNLVISPPQELNETETMAERISHERQPAPLVSGDGFLKLRAGGDRLLHSGFNFFDDEIEMNRRPMTIVTAALRGGRQCNF